MPSPDLAAYLDRIAHRGPTTPTLENLRALHLAHQQAIPFENLDVLLDRRINIDLAAVERKLVGDRRGGYCFEQNNLFGAVLRALGYTVTPLLARVRRNAPDDRRTPLTHMLLRVDLDGRPWLADVGFGAAGTTAPLALDTAEPQKTPHGTHRIIPAGGQLMHQALLGEDWSDLYEFIPREAVPVDFEVGNWYSCTHPQAHFRNNFVVTRVDGPRRLSVFNGEFSIRHPDGVAEKQPITSPAELLHLLAETFGLRFPAGTRFQLPPPATATVPAAPPG